MPQRIDVPGMGVVEFPDGMSDDQIAAAIRKNLGEPKPAMSKGERFAAGMADPIHGGAQLLTKMLPDGMVNAGNSLNNWLADKTGLVAKLPAGGVDEAVKTREADYKARSGVEGMDWMRLAGNVASPVNMALGAAAPAAKALAARSAIGAGVGVSSGALQPVIGDDFASEKLKQVSISGIGGAAAPLLAAGFGRMISPKASVNPDLALLAKEGVKPTIGQTLGGRWNAAEEKLQSLPIMGDMITNARGKALEQFNRAAIGRATSPVGASVGEVGRSGVKAAGDAVSQSYDDVLKSLKVVKFDAQYGKDFGQLKSMAQSLTQPMRQKFNNAAREVLQGRTSKIGGMTAETMKKVDSELGQMAARYGRSSVASEQELGDAVKQLQALLREQVARNSPQAADALKKANAGWANLVRVEGAAKAAKNNDGIFTPAQLNAAIQQADSSVRKRAVARGTALMQDLGGAGQNVLGNKVPNSGTFDRAAMGVGGLSAGLIEPWIPAALIGGAGMYSQPVQSLLRGAVSARPSSAESIARILNQTSPMLSPATGLLGVNLLE